MTGIDSRHREGLQRMVEAGMTYGTVQEDRKDVFEVDIPIYVRCNTNRSNYIRPIISREGECQLLGVSGLLVCPTVV